MTTEYKQKNDIIDLYDILGLSNDVCKQDNCNGIIHKAYIKKAKVCHPDKHPGNKDVAEIFELLTSAYNILIDDKKRDAYNHKLKLNKQSSNDYFKLRKGATDYSKTIGEYVPPSDQQKLSFKDQMRVINEKRGYDPMDETTIPADKARKKMQDMSSIRSAQDRDLKPEMLFDTGRFDLKKFNAAFDIVHNKENEAMVQYTGAPSAWNYVGSTANYSMFDDLDNIYVEDDSRLDVSMQTYGSVDFAPPLKTLSKDDMASIKGADYVDGHNTISDTYYSDIKAKLRDRNSNASGFEKMTYGDFKRDDTAGYGIFDQLGFKFDDRLALDVDEDHISKKFEKLVSEKQQQDITDLGSGSGRQSNSSSNQSQKRKILGPGR